jgi:hypothetical protein
MARQGCIRRAPGISVVMTTLIHAADLLDTEGFDVDSGDGAIGRVEEIWLGAG